MKKLSSPFAILILTCVFAYKANAQVFSSAFLPLKNRGQSVRMAYTVVTPSKGVKTKQTPFLLLHGKNFDGQYWKETATFLAARGYRVIMPDQIGFGQSSRPDMAYSFDLLADNTVKLLDKLKLRQVNLVGHSMGGMLATKFARKFPHRVRKLVLEDPIGLEDYGAMTGPVPLETLYATELKNTDPTKIRAFFKRYFATWKPQYESLAEPAIRATRSPRFPALAKASAQTYKMILEQPVVGEFPKLRVPTLLVVGEDDHTVVGATYMTTDKVKRAGHYPELGKRAVKAIPNAKLIQMANCGHIPHIEAPKRFRAALLAFTEKSS